MPCIQINYTIRNWFTTIPIQPFFNPKKLLLGDVPSDIVAITHNLHVSSSMQTACQTKGIICAPVKLCVAKYAKYARFKFVEIPLTRKTRAWLAIESTSSREQ